ncbi:MAG TPA: Gfo/Idh/MocA family oxidoreductase [Bryobacteraceae bacterium]|nr:Gfo/Idh/MocA family oxidoreductase [Bryobacteraceae bacterium]
MGAVTAGRAQARGKYRAAIIGHTGAGNYGHEWDATWNDIEGVEVVAAADVNEAGRKKAAARSRAQRSYADFREMLQKEKPNLVAICPRALEERIPMISAAAEVGAHILVEKPMAKNLAEADQIVRIAAEHRIKIAVGLVMRSAPVMIKAREMVAAGEIGMLQEMRARGKEDRRAGGEDMVVLGSHLFDLMRMFAGDPRWVFAHVTEDGREMDRTRARVPTEPVGPVAGNQIAAMFAFDGAVHGYFGSKTSDVLEGNRFGLTLYGSKGVIFIPITEYPDGEPSLMLSKTWRPDDRDSHWRRIEPPPGRGAPKRQQGNTFTAMDLIQAIEQNRAPACSAVDGRWTVEMAQGVYLSQISGGRIPFPLKERRFPLGSG